MTTTEAKDALNCVSDADLARALGISTSAVSQWGERVPPLRAYQIRDLLAARGAGQQAEHQEAA